MSRPKLGELCAGYGGLGMGVAAVTGAELAWVSEIDKGANKILAHRFPTVPNIGDFTAVDWSTVEPVDILTAGFPCQPVSHAGKRLGDNDERWLWDDVARAVRELRPGLVVLENVRGLLTAGGGRLFGRVVGTLAADGYDAQWHGLRAADVGAPHGRFRVFVIAYAHSEGRSGIGWQHTARRDVDGRRGPHGLRPATEPAPLLPTPTSSDTNGAGAHGDGGLDLRTAVSLLPTATTDDPAARIIVERSEVDEESGCRVWTGWTNGAYGKFSIGNTKMFAHRAAYELSRGPIPDGYEIDHLCQNPLCVNADHLEAVTPEENRRRVTERRTHCKRGHEFTEENTYWVRPGARACQACRAWQDKVQKARKKGAPEPEPPLLPTPVTNDMGEGKTPDAWDEWTAKMQAAHGNGNGHGKSLAIEAQRLLPTPTTSFSQRDPEAWRDGRPAGNGGRRDAIGDLEIVAKMQAQEQDWGIYADAIARWEALTRPAPAPTQPSKKGTPQLSPAFSEWLMGLPEGHVTGVPGLSRNDMLKALGNGVVPAQAAAAVRFLLNVTEAAA